MAERIPNAVAAVQLNLMLVATACVAWLLHRSLESRALGITFFVLIFVRPSGYFLLASLGYLLIAIRKWRPTLWVVVPIIVSLAGLATYNTASYGHFGTQAFGGISLYGIVAHRTEPLALTVATLYYLSRLQGAVIGRGIELKRSSLGLFAVLRKQDI
ncbi:MAG: hypothetical protein O7C67_04400 [Gammaproteobacteria bacterium]|nr:hypothetical protein [Gammaproteobacteria bacterium]